jgi:hypothetical protein
LLWEKINGLKEDVVKGVKGRWEKECFRDVFKEHDFIMIYIFKANVAFNNLLQSIIKSLSSAISIVVLWNLSTKLKQL